MSVIEPDDDFDDEAEDEESSGEELYQLSGPDARLVDAMARLCLRLAGAPGLGYQELIGLAFYGLRRMPKPIPDLEMGLFISTPLRGDHRFKLQRIWSVDFESEPAINLSSGGWVEIEQNGGDLFTRFDWRGGLGFPAEFANYGDSLGLLDSIHWPRDIPTFDLWVDELNRIDASSGYSVKVELYRCPETLDEDFDVDPVVPPLKRWEEDF